MNQRPPTATELEIDRLEALGYSPASIGRAVGFDAILASFLQVQDSKRMIRLLEMVKPGTRNEPDPSALTDPLDPSQAFTRV